LIGRLPADTFDEAKILVNKIISYERTPPYGTWARNVLLIGAKLGGFDDYGVYSAELICQRLINETFQNRDLAIYKLYTLPGGFSNISAVTLNSLVNKGVSIIHITSHANAYHIADYHSRDFLNVSIAARLTNGEKLPFIEAIGPCSTLESYYRTMGAAMEQTVAEIMLKSEKGGAIGWVGAVSYSMTGSVFHLFWKSFFNASTGQQKLGLALMHAKNEGWELFGKNQTPRYRYLQLSSGINLLGDPELSVLTEEVPPPLPHYALYTTIAIIAIIATVVTAAFYRERRKGGKSLEPPVSPVSTFRKPFFPFFTFS